MFMLGARGESPESDPTPAIARFVNVEPSAALNAPLWPTLLMTLATTSSAVISPFRMFTLAALEVLCAPASAAPISPDVMLLRKSDDSAPATLIAPPSASASAPSVPETAGSTAIGDWALEPSGVLTYVLYAWPPTDWALPTAASPTTSPMTSPRAARRFTQCMLLPFICSLLPWIPMANELGWCRPLMTRAPGGARFPRTKGCGTPAHRIDVEPRWGATALRPATIVVAHLELRVFTTATRIDPRHHVGVGDTHHETNAPRGIGEHVGFHGFAAEGVDAVVDRYVPGDLERMTVDLDLALLHEAPTGLAIHRQEDVEPEGKFPFWIEGGRIEGWRLASRRFICCVVIGAGGICGVDAPTARPLPSGALGRPRRHPEARLRRHADFRLVGTRRGQQSGRNDARPDD